MLLCAAVRAEEVGLPLNTFTTVHFGALGLTEAETAEAVTRFCKLARDWLRRHGLRTAWLWVREHGEAKGAHLHLLWHVPPEVHLGQFPRGWAARAARHPYRRGAVKTRRLRGSSVNEPVSRDQLRENTTAVIRYLLKGLAPSDAAVLGLQQGGCGGTVIGKRCGISTNLGIPMS